MSNFVRGAIVVLVLIAGIAVGGLALPQLTAKHNTESTESTESTSCHVGGQGAFTTPDANCTPGSFDALSLADVCRHRDRPSLSTAERRAIVTEYGVPSWSGSDGELDHRVPFFLGGRTDRTNLWPERGSIPNTKDWLEVYLRRRVCVDHDMRVRTVRRIFLADWRHAYRTYHARAAAAGAGVAHSATSYCLRGIMADGSYTRPRSLAHNGYPLGTHVWVTPAIRGLHRWVVRDRIGYGSQADFWTPSCSAARAFGRRTVYIRRGWRR